MKWVSKLLITLVVVLLLTIPVALLAMRIAERVCR